MLSPDYGKLNRTQKMAAFLIVVGPEAAAEVTRGFSDPELEGLCREIAKLPMVDEPTRQAVLEEFTTILGPACDAVLGGPAYARQTLELARGEYRAAQLLERAVPATTTSAAGGTHHPHEDVLREVGLMEARQVCNLVRQEQPQTIAFVLAHLGRDQAAAVVALLPPDLRAEVIERLGQMEPTSPETAGKVVRNLTKRLDQKLFKSARQRRGGLQTAADVLKGLEKDVSKAVLARIQERNAALGESIRKKLFAFEDLVRLTPADLQRVMREVDMADLATALKSAPDPLLRAITGAISKRAAESLAEEIALLGSVRRRDVEAAQDRIIAAVRRAEESGEISLDQEDEP